MSMSMIDEEMVELQNFKIIPVKGGYLLKKLIISRRGRCRVIEIGLGSFSSLEAVFRKLREMSGHSEKDAMVIEEFFKIVEKRKKDKQSFVKKACKKLKKKRARKKKIVVTPKIKIGKLKKKVTPSPMPKPKTKPKTKPKAKPKVILSNRRPIDLHKSTRAIHDKNIEKDIKKRIFKSPFPTKLTDGH